MSTLLYNFYLRDNSDIMEIAVTTYQKNEATTRELVIDKENTCMIEYELVRRLGNHKKYFLY